MRGLMYLGKAVLYAVGLALECLGLIAAVFVAGFLLFSLCMAAEQALDFLREVL